MREQLKKCSQCGGEKPVTDYYPKGKRFDSRCKPCVLRLKQLKALEKKKASKAKVTRGKLLTNLEVIPLKAADLPTEPLELWVQYLEGA